MDYDAALRQATLNLAILQFALVNGVVIFMGVALAIGPISPEAEGLDVLRWVVLGLPLIELPAAAQVYGLLGRRIRDGEGWQARLAALRSRTIVVAAMLEAPALLAGIVTLLLGFSWHVIPALALFAAGLALIAPTPRRVVQQVGREDGRIPDQYS
ncbi:MAG: hypothetical protein M5U25_17150 [Planctomycetota bacterium]|nr:hypothetical protein [Planctomycetota bacterium]